MKEPVEIPSQFPTLTAWCEALAREGLNPREIRQKTNCSKSTAYNAFNKIEKEKQKGEALKPEVKVEEIKKEVLEIEEPPTVEEAEPAQPSMEGIGAKLITGAILDPEDLEYGLSLINELFPEKHKRPQKSMRFLGKIWYKPANRILQQYMEENIDVYFAGIFTVIAFAPAIYGTLKDLTGKKTKKKKREEET